MISKEEVQNLAELARLQLNDAEVAALQQDISKILDYVGQISAAGEAAYARPKHRNVLRDDVERGNDNLMAGKRESILTQLPKREGDYAVVRKIIQKDE